MRYFIDAFVWVLGRLFALFIICGVLGGIFADIPGVAEDPSAKVAVSFISRSFNWALTAVREYPLGVLMFLLSCAVLRMTVIYPHVEAMKKEIAASRHNKALPPKPKRANVKRGRKRR